MWVTWQHYGDLVLRGVSVGGICVCQVAVTVANSKSPELSSDSYVFTWGVLNSESPIYKQNMPDVNSVTQTYTEFTHQTLQILSGSRNMASSEHVKYKLAY